MKRLTVIGGGPGGYTAAFAAARAGMEVTLIEASRMGGTCLNSGCIPTKTLKASAEALETALRLAEFGISCEGTPKVDPAAVLARKEKVMATLRGGLEKACAKLKVRLCLGHGRIADARHVEITAADGSVETVENDALIIATGSRVAQLPGLAFDHSHILSSDDALQLDRIPERLIIVGGGVIGCEMAFIYRTFGAQVTVVEGQNRLLPMPSTDADVSTLLQREMKKRRITCELGRTLKDVRVEDNVVRATLTVSPFVDKPTPAQLKEAAVEADMVLVTVGRAPSTEGLGLQEAGIEVDRRGWIVVDEQLRTSLPEVYAIGDVLGPSHVMLAHAASMEALCVVESLCGSPRVMRYDAMPSGVFTSPEVGCVGLSEQQAREQGLDVRCATFQMRELGKAQAMAELPGFFKLVADARTGRVLGAHIAGAHASDMVAEAALAVTGGLTVEQLTGTIHAHPTLAEGLYEAALLLKENA
ncbi:MAG: dihydrolipoyl dehydrogenase [Desulfovibrionaceae bacterium]|nr:dihydrolipoyl dehydrogenase [Desulfovibrionaceae bacterium]